MQILTKIKYKKFCLRENPLSRLGDIHILKGIERALDLIYGQQQYNIKQNKKKAQKNDTYLVSLSETINLSHNITEMPTNLQEGGMSLKFLSHINSSNQ